MDIWLADLLYTSLTNGWGGGQTWLLIMQNLCPFSILCLIKFKRISSTLWFCPCTGARGDCFVMLCSWDNVALLISDDYSLLLDKQRNQWMVRVTPELPDLANKVWLLLTTRLSSSVRETNITGKIINCQNSGIPSNKQMQNICQIWHLLSNKPK